MGVAPAMADPAWYDASFKEFEHAQKFYDREQFRPITAWYPKNGKMLAIVPQESLEYNITETRRNKGLWNKKFNATLISLGFLRCENDLCCYVLKDKSMIVMVHVDDCIILGTDKKRIQHFKTGLENEYEIKDLGPVLGDRTHRHKNRFPLRRN